jgi:hypothetical protein
VEVLDWNGEALPLGTWEISRKIDGVRCHNHNGVMLSRSGNPLYNIPDFEGEVAEIFCGSFNETLSNVSTFTVKKEISKSQVYKLRPIIDNRLHIVTITSALTSDTINRIYETARNDGFEGIVIRNICTDVSYRKKPHQTMDTEILDIVEGKSLSTKGLIASFVTKYGNVNAKTKALREMKRENVIGKTIEVIFMEFTPKGKFRQPRFSRWRPDKDKS